MRLKNRVAIITGGGTGIGKATAITFASEGAAVVVASRTLSALQQVVDEIQSKGGSAIALQADLSDENQIHNMIGSTIKKFGKIDILVNNSAAIAGESVPVVDMTVEHWNKAMAVNLTGTMLCSREVLKSMIARKSGSIINVSSIAGVTGYAGASQYSSSKWGIIGFTETLAVEVGKYNIRVNSLSPAGTDTENFRNFVKNRAEATGTSFDELYQRIISPYSLGRLATTDEVAKAALFLASDDSSAITGQNLVVSCGYHLMHFREVI